MSDLIDDPTPGQNMPEYTVSEISGEIKRTLEGSFGRVRVRGEVGRVFRARSGHLYFDVKDDRSVLACTTWKGQVASLSVVPEEGLEVVVTGRLTAFGGQSKYNLNVDEVAVAGQGALMALLEKRKKQLAAEGLFDPARKKPLPYLPRIIGVVTSPSGAVIRDILHRLHDRFPRKVLIWPVAVQGQSCAAEVARAIEGFNRLQPGGALPRPDLIIVARGGGSVEDLWGFNEEIVARAAAASDIPLISAVGHETDTTLIDFVSDRRAPTPTAAAELAVPVRLELMAWADGMGARLSRAATTGLAQRRQRIGDLSRALPRGEALLDGPRQRLDWIAERLPRALSGGVQRRRMTLSEVAGGLRPSALRGLLARRRDRLNAARLTLAPISREIARRRERITTLSGRLETAHRQRLDRMRRQLDATDRLLSSLGYEATLERGYAVVRAGEHVITRRDAAGREPHLEIQFADGRLAVTPTGAITPPVPPAPAPAAPRKRTKPSSPPDQGSLF
ncbi:exodeoxyribonuclease VII large subunit [Antarcticimicrobium luteum]|uniref:Exodeoxyribonuclease 7 large subunit n=1 Tax=Antarcticimicrobium luteum TaxID=2547397 RepID=A0A4R5UVK0_9RHOB|nr:exodeoxyribonuclease VII large subunit [Antarcticimicrobium luteum]TDK43105.1 exodeoxyribonuclease VII large subunit [Antarcticimicrobium luteum]